MATSDSDGDFESADEELNFRDNSMINSRNQRRGRAANSATIDSDSDDDNECIPSNVNSASWSSEISTDSRRDRAAVDKHLNPQEHQPKDLSAEMKESDQANKNKFTPTLSMQKVGQQDDAQNIKAPSLSGEKKNVEEDLRSGLVSKQRPERQRKSKEQKPAGFGAKKLGSKILAEPTSTRPSADEFVTPADIRKKAKAEGKEPPIIQECWEFDEEEATKILQEESSSWSKSKVDDSSSFEDVPEELKSNKSFKEVFKPDTWESLDNKGAILSELKEEKVQPVLDKLAEVGDEKSSGGWGSWGDWGYDTLLNTASMASIGVSTLSNHVSHGLSILEESIAVADPDESQKNTSRDPEKSVEHDKKESNVVDNQSMGTFGFGNFMYGVSSITKLVESTGTRVISSGLGTLETIGKKTMEVLQEGDPGLKKKRAFFMNEDDKPILSQMLREAKDKAEVEEKSVEGKQLARKVHFETLFDDFQGLVHLEALEMLSKQSNMKIQQRLATLDYDEMISLQETIDEVKELCDLGDEDDEDDIENGNLIEKLRTPCSDLGVAITYDKINEILEKTTNYIADVSKPENIVSEVEIFQRAISTLAQFTAYSVERFHKTAELLLIKERRSTVNEADSLVQLTKILSGQIGVTASLFSKCLNEREKKSENSPDSVDITTIFLEATNASSYIQDAFRLLIPILQVGAI